MTLSSANEALFSRYRAILLERGARPVISEGGCDENHLLWMCEQAQSHLTDWPLDKTSRWLGFIQGCLTVRGVLSVQEEREFSRPLFHAAYRAQGDCPPPSVGI